MDRYTHLIEQQTKVYEATRLYRLLEAHEEREGQPKSELLTKLQAKINQITDGILRFAMDHFEMDYSEATKTVTRDLFDGRRPDPTSVESLKATPDGVVSIAIFRHILVVAKAPIDTSQLKNYLEHADRVSPVIFP